MGSALSTGVAAAVQAADNAELNEVLAGLTEESKIRLRTALNDPPKTKTAKLRIKSAKAHFHAPSAVGGAPKPEWMAKIDEVAKQFADGLCSGGRNDSLICLFAEDAVWCDPVGGPPPYTGIEALKGRIEKLPPMDSAEVKEVFYSMSPKFFLLKTEVTMTGKPPIIVLDWVEANDEMKFVRVESHFHPPSAFGAPRPGWMEHCDELAKAFGDGLFRKEGGQQLIDLFTADGSWSDPVPSPPYVGTKALEDRIQKLPPMDSVQVKEVFYSLDPMVFLAKTEVQFTGKEPFVILDKFELTKEE